MADLVLIIDKAEVTWIPPRFGTYTAIIEQYSTTDSVIHLCCDSVKGLTFTGQNVIPAMYTMMGKSVSLVNRPTAILEVKGPIEFYFLDHKLQRMTTGTPAIRLIIEEDSK